MEQKLQKIKEAVAGELACSAHSLDHVMRVYNLSLRLAEGEEVDLDVLKAAVVKSALSNGLAIAGPRKAQYRLPHVQTVVVIHPLAE